MISQNNHPIPDEVKMPAIQSIQTRRQLKDYLRQVRFIQVYGEYEGRRFEGKMVIQNSSNHFLLTKTLEEMDAVGHYTSFSELPETITCIVWGNVRQIEFREDGFRFGDLDFRYVQAGQGELMTKAEWEACLSEHYRTGIEEYMEANPEWALEFVMALYRAGVAMERTEAERQQLQEQQRLAREAAERERLLEVEHLRMEITERQARIRALQGDRSRRRMR